MEVQRNGHKIKITLADGPSKLERLTQRSNVMNGDPEDIVHCDWLFEMVTRKAVEINWTRDPFARLIAASAIARGYSLITKNENMLNNLSLATW